MPAKFSLRTGYFFLIQKDNADNGQSPGQFYHALHYQFNIGIFNMYLWYALLLGSNFQYHDMLELIVIL